MLVFWNEINFIFYISQTKKFMGVRSGDAMAIPIHLTSPKRFCTAYHHVTEYYSAEINIWIHLVLYTIPTERITNPKEIVNKWEALALQNQKHGILNLLLLHHIHRDNGFKSRDIQITYRRYLSSSSSNNWMGPFAQSSFPTLCRECYRSYRFSEILPSPTDNFPRLYIKSLAPVALFIPVKQFAPFKLELFKDQRCPKNGWL